MVQAGQNRGAIIWNAMFSSFNLNTEHNIGKDSCNRCCSQPYLFRRSSLPAPETRLAIKTGREGRKEGRKEGRALVVQSLCPTISLFFKILPCFRLLKVLFEKKVITLLEASPRRSQVTPIEFLRTQYPLSMNVNGCRSQWGPSREQNKPLLPSLSIWPETKSGKTFQSRAAYGHGYRLLHYAMGCKTAIVLDPWRILSRG